MKSLKNELFKLWTATLAFLTTLEREQPSQHNTVLLFSCKVLLFMTRSLTDAFSPHLMRLYHSSIQGDLLFSKFTLVALSCLCACLKDLWEQASHCNVSSVLHVYHLYGVKTRVRPLAEVHCLGSRFKKLDCAKDWQKEKAVRFIGPLSSGIFQQMIGISPAISPFCLRPLSLRANNEIDHYVRFVCIPCPRPWAHAHT